MSIESEYNPTIKETPTHSEYSTVRNTETHIPEVTLEFEGEVPVKLIAGLRNYEIIATKETQLAEKFFAHTVERDSEGNITSVNFENKQAAMFFGQVTGKYKKGVAISYLAQATQDELDLAHLESPGTTINGIRGVSDRLIKDRLVKEAATGAQHDTRNEVLLAPRDLVLNAKRKIEQEARAYTSTYNPKIDNNQVVFPENDWYSNMTEEVLEWVEGLQKAGVEVTVQHTSFQTGQRPFAINNVLIGDIDASPEESYYLEKEVARVVIFAAETLKMRVRPELYIYNTALFEEDTPWGTLTSRLSHFINTSASQSRNMILISDSAIQVADAIEYENEDDLRITTHNSVSKANKRRNIHHETGHFVDSNIWSATRPQAEAFARSIENGFSFNNAVRKLRSGMDYGREVTPDLLYYIFSNNPEGVTAPETYDVSSTFFCWLYEKLGPDAVRMFYGKLSGRYFEPWGKGVQRLKSEIESRKPRKQYKGNVLNCLDSLPHDHRWTWENSEKLVEEYIKDVNHGIRTPAESVTSIAPLEDPTELSE